jgi:hypothetical protein
MGTQDIETQDELVGNLNNKHPSPQMAPPQGQHYQWLFQ